MITLLFGPDGAGKSDWMRAVSSLYLPACTSWPSVERLMRDIVGGLRVESVCVEHPGSRMHVSLHGDMTDVLLDASMHAHVIVETHLEMVLLRVRRRVAEGLDPSHVDLRWVAYGHWPRRLRIGSDGWVDGWPSTTYDCIYDEVAAIQRAAKTR